MFWSEEIGKDLPRTSLDWHFRAQLLLVGSCTLFSHKGASLPFACKDCWHLEHRKQNLLLRATLFSQQNFMTRWQLSSTTQGCNSACIQPPAWAALRLLENRHLIFFGTCHCRTTAILADGPESIHHGALLQAHVVGSSTLSCFVCQCQHQAHWSPHMLSTILP